MEKFKNREEAFAAQNFDPEAVKIEGVPSQHIEAVRGFINLCVAHDAINPDFRPDFSDWDQNKYEARFENFNPSGAGFSFNGFGIRGTRSSVGSRLVGESFGGRFASSPSSSKMTGRKT